METTAEGLGEILKGVAIRPPRPEDAGLEDCALPPESIREAFSRAADAIKSRIASSDEEDDNYCYEKSGACIQNPGPCIQDLGSPAQEEEEMGGKRSCVVDGDDDVLEGVHGGARKEGQGKGEDGLDEDDDKPILVEGH